MKKTKQTLAVLTAMTLSFGTLSALSVSAEEEFTFSVEIIEVTVEMPPSVDETLDGETFLYESIETIGSTVETTDHTLGSYCDYTLADLTFSEHPYYTYDFYSLEQDEASYLVIGYDADVPVAIFSFNLERSNLVSVTPLDSLDYVQNALTSGEEVWFGSAVIDALPHSLIYTNGVFYEYSLWQTELDYGWGEIPYSELNNGIVDLQSMDDLDAMRDLLDGEETFYQKLKEINSSAEEADAQLESLCGVSLADLTFCEHPYFLYDFNTLEWVVDKYHNGYDYNLLGWLSDVYLIVGYEEDVPAVIFTFDMQQNTLTVTSLEGQEFVQNALLNCEQVIFGSAEIDGTTYSLIYADGAFYEYSVWNTAVELDDIYNAIHGGEADSDTEEEPDAVYCGDVNLDGIVNLTDAVLLNRALSGAVTLTEEQIVYSDCNGDGLITAEDSILLLHFLVHYVDTLPYTEG